MLTIKALPDGSEEALVCLGSLCPLENEPSRGVCLTKKITVERIGSFKKKLVTPYYNRGVMSRLGVTNPNRSFDPTHCLGALCSGMSMTPAGYVARNSGAHRFCLPVYPVAAVSSAFYRIAGYMVTEEGFVAVTKRRTLLWCLLGLCAGSAFFLTYLLLQYGTQGALTELALLWEAVLP